MGREKEETSSLLSDDLGLFEDVMETLSSTQSNEESDEEIDKKPGDETSEDEDNEQNPRLDETEDEESEDKDESSDDEDSDDESDEGTDQEEESSLFTPYAKLLVDEGVFSNLDLEKFDGTVTGLKDAMNKEITYYVDRYKEEMPQEVKRLLNGYEQGVPFDEMVKISSDRIRYDNIDETKLTDNTDLQKMLVKDYLDQTTQLTDGMKSEMITQFEDGMKLEEQSKVALSELKGIQDKKEQEAVKREQDQRNENQAQQDAMLDKFNRHLNDTAEIIPGIKINQVMRDKIRSNLTVPVEYDQYGTPVNKLSKYMQENPVEGETILNYLFEVTGGFKDWGAFGKAGKSEAIKEMEAAARAADGKNRGSRAKKGSSQATNDLAKGIQGFLNR